MDTLKMTVAIFETSSGFRVAGTSPIEALPHYTRISEYADIEFKERDQAEVEAAWQRNAELLARLPVKSREQN